MSASDEAVTFTNVPKNSFGSDVQVLYHRDTKRIGLVLTGKDGVTARRALNPAQTLQFRKAVDDAVRKARA